MLRITLPLPGKDLSPNARPHFMAKAKQVRELRQATAIEAMVWCRENANTFPWPEATIQLTFYFARNGRRDPDNLLASAKAAFDGLRDAGVLMDDDKITHLPVEWKKDKDHPRLVLELYP